MTLGGVGLAHAMMLGHALTIQEMASKQGIDVLIEPEPREQEPGPAAWREKADAEQRAYEGARARRERSRDDYIKAAMTAAEDKRARKEARRAALARAQETSPALAQKDQDNG